MEISLGRLRGGWCCYWTDPATGKRRRYQLAARTQQEAQAEALRKHREVTFADRPVGHTVADIWAAYVEDLGEKPTAKTMGFTGKAILPFFGAYTPDQITKKLCQEYAAQRVEAGKSQGTVWTELGHLQSAMKFGEAIRVTDRAPKVWRPQKPQSDMRILDRGEARSLIEGAHDPHVRLALILLLETAGRVGAVLDLTWDRVDLDGGSINLRLPDSATRKGRAHVPMSRSARAALTAASEAALTDYVIEYGARRVKSIRTGFKAAAGRAKLGHIRIHDLRHTAAVTMLSAGVRIEKVAQYLGHSNPGVTYSTYARFLPSHMQDAADVLDFASFRKGA